MRGLDRNNFLGILSIRKSHRTRNINFTIHSERFKKKKKDTLINLLGDWREDVVLTHLTASAKLNVVQPVRVHFN